MSGFDAVLAVDRTWGIGRDNQLPWPRLRGDLQHFKRITSSGATNAVLMGRKTWDSINGKPLGGRTNIVISRRALEVPEGVIAVPSLDDAVAAAARVASDAFVIGGAQIYVLALAHPALRWVYLTRVEGEFACDAHVPDLDRLGFVVDRAWSGACRGEDNGVHYSIERLSRR